MFREVSQRQRVALVDAAMLGVEKFLADVRDADGVELLDERLHTRIGGDKRFRVEGRVLR